jgi:uncharacterized protein
MTKRYTIAGATLSLLLATAMCAHASDRANISIAVAPPSVPLVSKSNYAAPEDSTHCSSIGRPTILKLATGQVQGVYYNVGRKLRDLLERTLPDVCIEVWLSDGAVTNLKLLNENRVELALIQQDVASASPQMRTVLGLTQESLQVVVGPDFHGDSISGLSSHPLALGPMESGTHLTTSSLLKKLGIAASAEIPTQTSTEMVEVLRKGTAHAEFFISGAPNPKVALLLADPYFRLLSFQTSEIRALVNDYAPDGTRTKARYYSVLTIPPHTYPHQNRPINTIAVTALLMCRQNAPEKLIQRITTAILNDVGSANPSLRQSLAAIDLPSTLDLTMDAEPLHKGARLAIDSLSFAQRHEDILHFGVWIALLCLAVMTLSAAHFRSLRLWMLRFVTAPVRLAPTTVGHLSSTSVQHNGRITRVSYRILRRVFFHRMLWQVIRTLSLLVVIWLIGSLLMYYCERSDNVSFANLKESSLSILVYLFSGLEDRAPITDAGWLGAVIMLLSGLLLMAYITGQFASEIVQSTSGAIRMHTSVITDGFVIVGWNFRAELIVRELFGAFEAGLGEHKISVFCEDGHEQTTLGAGTETPPTAQYEGRGVTFFKANGSDPDVLERYRINNARAVIVTCDDNVSDPDAKTALCVLAIRDLCTRKGRGPAKGPLICAEAREHSKVKLIRQAGANEVICHQDYGLGILVQSALGTKISRVLHQLLSYQAEGCEIYFLECQPSLIGKSYLEAIEEASRLYKKASNPVIVIGVQHEDAVYLNPRHPLQLQANDSLIVIAWDKPLAAPNSLQAKATR